LAPKKKPSVFEERQQLEKLINKRIKTMEKKCYEDLVSKYT